MISSFLNRSFFQDILVWLLRTYLKFALGTTRWEFEVDPKAHQLLTGQKGSTALVVFWHETLILLPRLWGWALSQNADLQLYTLISRNRDGRLISRIVSPWKIQTVKGSTNKNGQDKGGAIALRQLLDLTKAGHLVAITPDGPRGPRHHLHPGLVHLGLLSRTAIVPVGAYCTSIRLKSWDRLIIPLPFGKGKIVCGSPLQVTKDNHETIHTLITDRLHEVNQQAQP